MLIRKLLKGSELMSRMKQISIDFEVEKAIFANKNSRSESENDVLRRMLLSLPPTAPQKNVATIAHPKEVKRRGKWSVHLLGEEHKAANMKDAYCTLLRLLADLDSGFLAQFSEQGSSARRFVADNELSVFIKSPHLAKDFATKLTEGWFVDTNVSEQQVGTRARVAARVAGI